MGIGDLVLEIEVLASRVFVDDQLSIAGMDALAQQENSRYHV
jgi:hypothetical protein